MIKRTNVYVMLSLVFGGITASAPADVPRPATEEQIGEMLASAGDSEDYDGADLVYVLDEADVRVAKTGLATTESCQVIKILTDKGVRLQSVLRWEFDPDTYRKTIKSVRIHRKDGGIEDVDVSTLTTHPAIQHMIFWGNQQHLLQVPRLEIGDALEIRVSKIGFNIAYLASDSGGGGARHDPCGLC